MSTRYQSANLNLAEMPAPVAIEGVSFEAILAERLADLTARYQAAGIDYNVGGLESDPAVKLQQADAYREMLDLARINDKVRSVMVAFAVGSDLEHLGGFYGVRRRLISPADPDANPPVAAVYESDAELRGRIQVAPEALPYAGLTGGGYRHRALEASSDVKDVRVVKRRDEAGHPVMDVVLLSRTGNGAASSGIIDAVFRAFLDDQATQLTDVVTVRSATIVPYTIDVTLRVPRGPDPALVGATAEANLALLAAASHRIGAVLPTDAVIAAGRVKPTEKLLLNAPVADVDPGIDGAGWCTGITVTVEVMDV